MMVKDGGTRKNGGSAQFMCSSSTLWATSRHFDCRLVRYMIHLVSWAKSRKLVLNEVKPRFTAKCIVNSGVPIAYIHIYSVLAGTKGLPEGFARFLGHDVMAVVVAPTPLYGGCARINRTTRF
ncbi:hypothetical protein D3C72_1868050 [compost metagenome]